MEPKSDWFCSLSENNAACIYDDRHFRELRTSDGGHEGSSLIDVAVENDMISGGTVCTRPGGDEMKDTEVPVGFVGSVEIKVENIDESLQKNDVLSDCRKNLQFEEPVGESCHVLYPHGDSSLTDIDVAGDCIKLFVDVFGPLDGLSNGTDSMICSLSENNAACIYDDRRFRELRTSDGGHEGSSLIDVAVENDMISGGTACTCPGGDEMKDTEVPVGFVRSGEIKVENINDSLLKNDVLSDSRKNLQFEEPVGESCRVSSPHGDSSPTDIDVSGDCIKLFVDVFGPLDGLSNDSDSIIDVKNASTTSGWEEDSFREHNGTYDVGDLVWAKTRTQIWWPGMVSDPSISANDATKNDKKDYLLVKYFGNANFAWCRPSDLKPFLEHFDQMSGQNSSRNFCGSIEKALSITGCRIKAEMTCPCFSKVNRTLIAGGSTESREKCSVPVYRRGMFGVLSAPQFHPRTFLARVRDTARSARGPGKAELTVTKNHLAAFYCSVGHHELPVQMLRSSGDSEKDTVDVSRISKPADERQDDISESSMAPEDSLRVSNRPKRNHNAAAAVLPLDSRTSSSGKGSESRERKKSKYLSYPFVSVNGKAAAPGTGQKKTQELNHGSSLSIKSTPVGGKSSWTNSTGGRNPFEADNIEACSSELLDNLRRTACGRIKYSDSLKRFYSSFRIFSFANDIIGNDAGGPSLTTSSPRRLPQNNIKAEAQIGVEVMKESGNDKGSIASVGCNNADCGVTKELLKTENLVGDGDKKKEPDVSVSVYTSGRDKDVIDPISTDVPKSKPAAQVVTPRLSQVPNLNANHPAMTTTATSSAGATAMSFIEALPEQRNDTFVSLNVDCGGQINMGSVTTIEDVRLALRSTTSPSQNGISGPSRCSNINFAARKSDMKMAELGSFFQQSVNAAKSEQRRRKRKSEKASEVASGIPDLNGTASDKTSSGWPDHDNAPPECKQHDKKRASSDPGGSLLLSFAPGCSLPPGETLSATFSRFGSLKESGIRILDESTVEIPYERSTEARFAFRSLEKRKPFGEALASFKLLCEAPAPRPKKRRTLPVQQQHLMPVNLAAKPGEAPGLAFMKQNVEMMKSTLENAGAGISREMRTKLENEIKVFLDRINSMADPSS